MDYYTTDANISVIILACKKMLNEKFNITLNDEALKSIVRDFSNEVKAEYEDMELQTKELNNITLSKIKAYIEVKQSQRTSQGLTQKTSLQQQPQQQPLQQQVQQQHTQQRSPQQQQPQQQPLQSQQQQPQKKSQISGPIREDVLDDDVIQVKLRNFEIQRKMIEQQALTTTSFQVAPAPHNPQTSTPIASQQANPINISIPTSINPKYKTIIINSINRDWSKQHARNGLRFALPIDPNAYKYYLDCICLPSFVKNITPYVLMSISDGHKNVVYSLTNVTSGSNSGWDVWRPVDDAENISIENKNWLIKLYDQTNAEIDLGSDGVNIIEVSMKQEDNHTDYIMKLEQEQFDYNEIKINDSILIKTCKNVYKKQIKEYNNQSLTISDNNKNISIADFINSTVLFVNKQYSIILKYHYNA